MYVWAEIRTQYMHVGSHTNSQAAARADSGGLTQNKNIADTFEWPLVFQHLEHLPDSHLTAYQDFLHPTTN